ncbi:MAG: hypothetical protein ACFE8A_07085 [Candidatus Hodarchaeota archaeon]
MVNFLLLVKNLINYNKNDIDIGKIPLEIYEICSCIREIFCLSYAIRKENNLFIYIQNDGILIKFEGKKLKYLGPDERSQALLLRKAIDNVNLFNSSDIENWKKSTPGIYVRKFSNNESFIKYFKSFVFFNPIFLINDNDVGKVNSFLTVNEFETLNTLSEFFYIIPAYNIIIEDSNFFQTFKDLKDIKFLTLSKINRIENKFLYINFRLDLLKK